MAKTKDKLDAFDADYFFKARKEVVEAEEIAKKANERLNNARIKYEGAVLMLAEKYNLRSNLDRIADDGEIIRGDEAE